MKHNWSPRENKRTIELEFMCYGESGPIMDAHDFINKEVEIIAMFDVERDWECLKHILKMYNWLWYVIIRIKNVVINMYVVLILVY